MGGQVERSGDERRTVHKRLWKVGIEKVMGKGQKVTTEIERWRREKKRKVQARENMDERKDEGNVE